MKFLLKLSFRNVNLIAAVFTWFSVFGSISGRRNICPEGLSIDDLCDCEKELRKEGGRKETASAQVNDHPIRLRGVRRSIALCIVARCRLVYLCAHLFHIIKKNQIKESTCNL